MHALLPIHTLECICHQATILPHHLPPPHPATLTAPVQAAQTTSSQPPAPVPSFSPAPDDSLSSPCGPTCEVLCPVESREALNEVHRLFRDIHPGQHVQDGAAQLPAPAHAPLIAPKLPILFGLVVVGCCCIAAAAAHHGGALQRRKGRRAVGRDGAGEAGAAGGWQGRIWMDGMRCSTSDCFETRACKACALLGCAVHAAVRVFKHTHCQVRQLSSAHSAGLGPHYRGLAETVLSDITFSCIADTVPHWL